jgi:septal ring factor EnvC (AmiA/AmiB activator)
MEQLIAKFQELVGEAKQLINQYKAKLVVLDDKEKLLEQEKSAYKILESDLNKREATVSHIENINKVAQDIETKTAILAKGQEDLATEKQSFTKYKDEQTQLITNQRAENEQEAKELKRRKENMEAEVSAKLEEVLKNFKK